VAGQDDDWRFEAVLAQVAHGFATIDIRQADVHDHEINLPALGSLHALAAVLNGDGLEFLVQRKLFRQRSAQFGIIVDNENFTCIRHQNPSISSSCSAITVPSSL